MHMHKRRMRLHGRLRRLAGCLLRRDRGRGRGRRCSRRTGMHTRNISTLNNNIHIHHTNNNDYNRTNRNRITSNTHSSTNARTLRRVPPSHPHRIQTRT